MESIFSAKRQPVFIAFHSKENQNHILLAEFNEDNGTLRKTFTVMF